MHLMLPAKAAKCILAVQKCIFASHFPKENVQQRVHFPLENVQLCKNAFDAYILLHKMLQMHLMQKCIFATRTFSKGKCSAYIVQRKMFSVHFPKENVQQNKMLQMHLMRCKNAFDAKMHLMQKCILATQRITFSFGKCSASHFPKENVQQSKMLQMHLMLCKNIFLHHILLVQKCI